MRIGARIFLLLAVPIVAVMALFGYLEERRSQRIWRQELAREGRAIAQPIRAVAELDLREGRDDDLQVLADRLTAFERIVGIRVLDQNEHVLVQSGSLDPYPFSDRKTLRFVLDQRHAGESYGVLGGRNVSRFYEPLEGQNGEILGAIEVVHHELAVEEDTRAARRSGIFLALAMIGTMGGLLFVVTRFTIGKPVAKLVRSFREVGFGDLSSRVPPEGFRGELTLLAQEFNGMCERLEAAHQQLLREQEERRQMEERLQRSEHMASLGRMTAALAHEVGTPLNVIRGRAEAILRTPRLDRDHRRKLHIIAEQIDRISQIVRGMLDFSRSRELRPRPADAGAGLRRALDLLGDRLFKHGIRVDVGIPDPAPPVMVDQDRMQQVFLNLIVNAIDAMPSGGTLRVSLVQVDRPHADKGGPAHPHIAMQFADSGEGIPPDALGRVFEPFFTTKEIGQGTGLGLAIAYGIVQDHGGWIETESQVGHGARFTVFLPVLDPAHAVAGRREAS